jgi:hypothetical protein
MNLFNRTCKVTVIKQPSGFTGENPQFFDTIGNALEIEGLHITFKATKHLAKEPNKAEIKIFNLSAHTRAQVEKLPLKVVLQAGYDGVARLLFTGNLTSAFSTREGRSDIVTTLIVGDGMRAFAHARMNRSYRPPIQVKRVLDDAAKSMGLQLPREVERSIELRQALANGISTRGATRDVLTRLLAPYGYSWSIQNGQLQVLKDEQLKPGRAFVINQQTGLIGKVQKTTPEKPKKKSEIKFDALLYPELFPGAEAQIEAEFFQGRIKMTDIEATGDNRTGDWTSSVTGRPL